MSETQLTVHDIAQALRCSPRSVYRLRGLRYREIPGVGRRYDAKDFRLWLQTHEQHAQRGRAA
jgi:hypothetical protein